MARGYNYDSSYDSSFQIVGVPKTGATSVAELVLSKYNVPFNFRDGSPLTGYDIKSQDALNMMKLSLFAESNGEKFKEIYCGSDGVARVVDVGETVAQAPNNLIFRSVSSSFVNKIDHVLVRAKQTLPTRYHKATIDLMGKGRPNQEVFNCLTGYITKDAAKGTDAWAEFEKSPQSKTVQDQIRLSVQRSKWENLVGYKMTIRDIPKYASFSLSQTTPRTTSIPFSNDFDTVISISLGTSTPEEGGIVDISSLTGTGAQVLDIAKGSDLVGAAPNIQQLEPSFSFTANDFYVLLDHECGLNSVSKGKNWFVVPGLSDDTANIILRKSSSTLDSVLSFGGTGSTVYFFRRLTGSVTNIQDVIRLNLINGSSPLDLLSSVAEYNPLRGTIITGLDSSNGYEMSALDMAYTIAKPSVQVRSPYGDAFSIANNLAQGGFLQTPIVVKEEPPGIGYNGRLVLPPAPPDQEGVAYEVESEVEQLEGSVIELSAPFLSNDEAAKFSGNLFALINGDSGVTENFVFESGGYDILPGMKFPENDGVVQNIEFIYADKDSVTTNVTTGPRYVPEGSYSDSIYIKRTESLTLEGLVVAGSNRDGIFFVDIEGRGRYQAINRLLEPIYPGDRVEVQLLNVPVEKN